MLFFPSKGYMTNTLKPNIYSRHGLIKEVVLPASTAAVQLLMQEIINEKHIVIFYIHFHSWHCILLCWADICLCGRTIQQKQGNQQPAGSQRNLVSWTKWRIFSVLKDYISWNYSHMCNYSTGFKTSWNLTMIVCLLSKTKILFRFYFCFPTLSWFSL